MKPSERPPHDKKPTATATDASRELAIDELEQVVGGAETVHLYLKANGTDIQGEST